MATVAFARLCADLLEKAGVQTDGTIFTKEEYKKKVHHGFLNLKSYEKTEIKYVPGEAYWLLNRIVENEERTGYRYEMQSIDALTKSGKIYTGDVREAYYPNGTYVLNTNEWRDCTAFNSISSLVPFLDLLLKRNKINMSSGMYWIQLHPEAAAPKAPASSKQAPVQQRTKAPIPTKQKQSYQKAKPRPTATGQPMKKQFKYVLTVPKTSDRNRLIKAIRTFYGISAKDAERWIDSSQDTLIRTNDKTEADKVVTMFRQNYGIYIIVNGETKQ